MDAKTEIDRRIEDLQKQLKDYQKNNEVIDELKRAHAKELADHVRESNKKYNDLLQEKLNAEDALNSKFEADKKALLADAEQRIRDAVEAARQEE